MLFRSSWCRSRFAKPPWFGFVLQIYKYAIQPYEQAHAQAWTAALVLISIIMLTVILFRFLASRGAIKGAS